MSIDRSSTAAGTTRWRLSAVVLLSIIAGIGLGIAITSLRRAPEIVHPLRVALLPVPDELQLGGSTDFPFGLALAADGRRLVFPASADGARGLWLRDLSHDVTEPLTGTGAAVLPFWAPDGESVGYFADGKLRTYALADGRVRDLADAPLPRGAAWHGDGDVIFAGGDGGLLRRRADGRVEPLTSLEGGETSHRFPRVLDENHVVFFVQADEAVRQGIWIAALDDPASRRRLTNSDAEGLPVGDALLYASGGALVAQRIDRERLTLAGRPLLLGQAVGRGPQHQLFATSGGDVLVFGTPMSPLRQLQWFDRAGERLAAVGEPMQAWDVRISPSGSTVAVTRVDPQLNTLDIWTYEHQRPLPRRISPNIDADDSPAWSRDGTTLAWVSGRRVISRRDARAAAPDVSLHKFDRQVRVTDWSPDGGWLVVTETSAASRGDITLVRATAGGERQPYVQSPFDESHGTISPGGRWLAYASDESGRAEIYVDAFPAPRRRARVTVGGGTEPRWNSAGTAIFFRRGSEIHVTHLAVTDGVVEATASERLFDAAADIRAFDVSADGRRFLLNVPADDAESRPMTAVVNISAVLRPLFEAPR